MRFSSFALGLVAVSAALVAAAPVPSADTTALVQRANGDNKEQDASNQPNSSSGEEEGEDPVKKERKGSKSSGTHGSGTSSAASDDATTSDSDSMSDSDILKTLPPNKQKAYNAMTPAKKKEFMAKQREQLTTGGAASDKKIENLSTNNNEDAISGVADPSASEKQAKYMKTVAQKQEAE